MSGHSTSDEKLYTKAEVKGLLLEYAQLHEQDKQPPRLSRSERRRLKKVERLQERIAELKDEPPEEAKYPITVEQAEHIQKETHFKGKKPIQFAKKKPEPEPEPEPARPKKRLRWGKKKQAMTDIASEQEAAPLTTDFSPEAIQEDGLREVRKHPQDYIEVNIVRNSRVVDTFYINGDKKKFHYKKREYDIKEEGIFLLPTKSSMFVPSCFYKENKPQPVGFKNLNKGITGKALSLLYMERLYMSLLAGDESKWNLFIVILSIAILIAYAVGCYFVFTHTGAAPQIPAIPLGG